jgi:hypothetical protein
MFIVPDDFAGAIRSGFGGVALLGWSPTAGNSSNILPPPARRRTGAFVALWIIKPSPFVNFDLSAWHPIMTLFRILSF